MKKEELKQEAPTVIACCVKCGKPTNLEQYVDEILIEELEKEKRYLVLELDRGKYTNEFVKGMDWAIKSLEEAVKDIKERKQ